jgi:hypothetical protein
LFHRSVPDKIMSRGKSIDERPARDRERFTEGISCGRPKKLAAPFPRLRWDEKAGRLGGIDKLPMGNALEARRKETGHEEE